MKALRLALASGCASVALLAGAWAGGASVHTGARQPALRQPEQPAVSHATPQDNPGLPAPGYPAGGSGIVVGDSLEVAGQPMRLSVFGTADRPSRVVAFYADAFRARGLLPVVSPEDSFAHVSAFDPAGGLQRFVSALPAPGGRTLVMTGTLDARRPSFLLRADASRSLPVPREHGPLLAFGSADGQARAESAQFLSGLSKDGIAAFYRAALLAQGYAERPDGPEGLLTFGKPGATLSVAARQVQGGSAVFVTRTEGGER